MQYTILSQSFYPPRKIECTGELFEQMGGGRGGGRIVEGVRGGGEGMVYLSIQGGSSGTFDLKGFISALQNSQKFCTTWTILFVFQWGLLRRATRYAMILKCTTPSFKDGKCFSDIVWENVFTVKYRAICCGLQHFRLYTPGVTLETPISKINIPVCIITCVWKSETIYLIL